jgi:phthalate 3,4-dioxygenase subunit beta
MSYAPSLPFDDPRHVAAHRFLVEEAAMLDAGEWARWLSQLTDDVRYVMPVRVTTVNDAGYDARTDMAHFDEDRYAIEKRVQRLLTDHAWTEDPASRTRHLVTNVRTFAGTGDDLDVESSLLLFRSRGDDRPAEYVCALRRDALRREDGAWRLAARRLTVEESVLRTQNLAIFL